MLRTVLVVIFSTAVAAAAQAQTGRRARPPQAGCEDGSDSDRARHCEVRESTVPAMNPIEVDAGRNGGIRVHGSDRGDVFVRAKIVGYADTDADARRIVAAVRVDATGGKIRAEGPDNGDDHWSVSFDLEVPRTAMLALNAHNGGIAIEEFRGSAEFHAQNGGVSLRDVSGDIRGTTTNGGLNIDLTGTGWDGPGLDVATRNGGVKLTVPANYSAELETGTTNGRVSIDFPVTVQGSVGRHFRTTLGAGGAKLRAMTTNGGVTIRQTQ